jgi:hypothetical protein
MATTVATMDKILVPDPLTAEPLAVILGLSHHHDRPRGVTMTTTTSPLTASFVVTYWLDGRTWQIPVVAASAGAAADRIVRDTGGFAIVDEVVAA